jgi:phenylacetate-CoA ligase
MRDHLWHQRDWRGAAAMIRVLGDRALRGPEGVAAPDWGPPASWLFATGKAFMLHIGHSVDHQLTWLQQIRPDYLLTYPTNALELARQAVRIGQSLPPLRELRLFGEAVDASSREELQQHWGVITDGYSANELGYLALQCPEFGDRYHIQAENVLLEVLDDQGRPCRPGEVGRVVVTPLHNYAMPLIRYENGDFAEVGEACPCGRGLPVLRRILGRTRNMLQLPDGSRRWPVVGFKTLRAIVPAIQFQILQQSLTEVELRLVAERPLTGAEEDRLRAAVCKALEHDFQVRVSCVAQIEREPGGKYEEFKSLLPAVPSLPLS